MKKIISIILVIAMCLSLWMPAMADDGDAVARLILTAKENHRQTRWFSLMKFFNTIIRAKQLYLHCIFDLSCVLHASRQDIPGTEKR